MDLLGSIRELVTAVFRVSSGDSVTLKPNTTTPPTADRTVELPQVDADETIVGRASTDTLTNKTIDGDDNTVQDLPETALKTVLANASKFFTRDASGIPESTTKDVPAGDVVGTSDSQTLTTKTIVAASNTITTAASGNLTSVELNAALAELQTELDTSTAHISDASDAHAGSAITNTPAGNLVATDMQAAVDELQTELDTATTHGSSTSNPHSVTATQVGLGNADNTSDADKPVSTATQTALDGKEDDLPLSTRGDTLYRNAANSTARLPVGTIGQVLTSDGTDISWEDSTGGSTVNELDDLTDATITTPTSTEVLTYNGSAWVNSPAAGGNGMFGTLSASTGNLTVLGNSRKGASGFTISTGDTWTINSGARFIVEGYLVVDGTLTLDAGSFSSIFSGGTGGGSPLNSTGMFERVSTTAGNRSIADGERHGVSEYEIAGDWTINSGGRLVAEDSLVVSGTLTAIGTCRFF